jgi:hypothetical protein
MMVLIAQILLRCSMLRNLNNHWFHEFCLKLEFSSDIEGCYSIQIKVEWIRTYLAIFIREINENIGKKRIKRKQ